MSTCLNTKSDGGSIYHFCDIEAIPYGLASLSGERLSTCKLNTFCPYLLKVQIFLGLRLRLCVIVEHVIRMIFEYPSNPSFFTITYSLMFWMYIRQRIISNNCNKTKGVNFLWSGNFEFVNMKLKKSHKYKTIQNYPSYEERC